MPCSYALLVLEKRIEYGLVSAVRHNCICPLSILRFGRRLLRRVLNSDLKASIKTPTAQEIRHYGEAIFAKYSILQDFYAKADGLKLYVQETGNGVIQNMFYNDWQHDHYVRNVLVFVPSGVVIAAAYNSPGCLHDSVIAEWGKVYQKLEETAESDVATSVVYSAFSKGDFLFLSNLHKICQ